MIPSPNNLKICFQKFNECDDELKKISPTGLIYDGINDFLFFSDIFRKYISENAQINQAPNYSAFIYLDMKISQFFKKKINKFQIHNYNFYSVFLKDSLSNQFITNFQQQSIKILSKTSDNNKTYDNFLYFGFNYNDDVSKLMNKIENKNKIFEVISIHLYPNLYICSCSSFTQLNEVYAELVQNEIWPIFVFPPKSSKLIQQEILIEHNIQNTRKLTRKLPMFNPEKHLFYVGFIKTTTSDYQRIKNCQKLYDINDISDAQINCIYNENEQTIRSNNQKSLKSFLLPTTRVFFGFDSLFRCYHVFDYLNDQTTKNNFIFDVILINNDNTCNFQVKHNLFYLEIPNLFFNTDPSRISQKSTVIEASTLYSINCVDIIADFTNSSSFLSFENEQDLVFAKQLFSNAKKSRKISRIRMIEQDDYSNFFDRKTTEILLNSNLSFLIFQLKTKNEKNSKEMIINNAKKVLQNVLSTKDNRYYHLIGMENSEEREKLYLSLKKSKYSKQIRSFYPEKVQKTRKNFSKNAPLFQSSSPDKPFIEFAEIDTCHSDDTVVNHSNSSDLTYAKRSQIVEFVPLQGHTYIYVEEIESTRPSFSTRLKDATLFGIRNISDLQRSFYFPGTEKVCTFFGLKESKQADFIKGNPNLRKTKSRGAFYYFQPSNEPKVEPSSSPSSSAAISTSSSELASPAANYLADSNSHENSHSDKTRNGPKSEPNPSSSILKQESHPAKVSDCVPMSKEQPSPNALNSLNSASKEAESSLSKKEAPNVKVKDFSPRVRQNKKLIQSSKDVESTEDSNSMISSIKSGMKAENIQPGSEKPMPRTDRMDQPKASSLDNNSDPEGSQEAQVPFQTNPVLSMKKKQEQNQQQLRVKEKETSESTAKMPKEDAKSSSSAAVKASKPKSFSQLLSEESSTPEASKTKSFSQLLSEESSTPEASKTKSSSEFSSDESMLASASEGQESLKPASSPKEESHISSSSDEEDEIPTSSTKSEPESPRNPNIKEFVPLPNLHYVYIEELTVKPYSMQSSDAHIFGIDDIDDVQRFYYMPKTNKICTFLGFFDRDMAEEAKKNPNFKSTKNRKALDYKPQITVTIKSGPGPSIEIIQAKAKPSDDQEKSANEAKPVAKKKQPETKPTIQIKAPESSKPTIQLKAPESSKLNSQLKVLDFKPLSNAVNQADLSLSKQSKNQTQTTEIQRPQKNLQISISLSEQSVKKASEVKSRTPTVVKASSQNHAQPKTIDFVPKSNQLAKSSSLNSSSSSSTKKVTPEISIKPPSSSPLQIPIKPPASVPTAAPVAPSKNVSDFTLKKPEQAQTRVQKDETEDDKNVPIFSPKPNLVYFYFAEATRSLLIHDQKVQPSLFGVQNKDNQRYVKHPTKNDGILYTFFGFDNDEDREKGIKKIESLTIKKKVPITLYETEKSNNNHSIQIRLNTHSLVKIKPGDFVCELDHSSISQEIREKISKTIFENGLKQNSQIGVINAKDQNVIQTVYSTQSPDILDKINSIVKHAICEEFNFKLFEDKNCSFFYFDERFLPKKILNPFICHLKTIPGVCNIQ